MNAEDSERKYDDISDYSQSMMHFFPHFYHSAKDSSIATQLYCRNVYHALRLHGWVCLLYVTRRQSVAVAATHRLPYNLRGDAP